MSDESLLEDELEPDAQKKGGRMVVVAAIIAAAGGAFAGLQFVGPAVGTSLASETAAEASSEKGEGYDDGYDDGAAPQVHMIDNLVVNPAGSGGSRFLIASIALAPGSGTTVETLAARDIELRDVLLRLLGSKTVDELSDIASRDVLAQEMIDRLAASLGEGVVRRVFMPQFVIQ